MPKRSAARTITSDDDTEDGHLKPHEATLNSFPTTTTTNMLMMMMMMETTMIPSHRTPTHPGEMLLEEFLKPLGMTQTTAAVKMNISLNRLND